MRRGRCFTSISSSSWSVRSYLTGRFVDISVASCVASAAAEEMSPSGPALRRFVQKAARHLGVQSREDGRYGRQVHALQLERRLEQDERSMLPEERHTSATGPIQSRRLPIVSGVRFRHLDLIPLVTEHLRCLLAQNVGHLLMRSRREKAMETYHVCSVSSTTIP